MTSILAPGDLFLTEAATGFVFTCRREGERAWRSDRPACLDVAYRWLLCHDGSGWVVQDPQCHAPRSAVQASPAPGLPEDPGRPPLGPWRGRKGQQYTLTDVEPALPHMGLPIELKTAFATIRIRQLGEDVVYITTRATGVAVTDSGLEDVLSKHGDILFGLARRPRITCIAKHDWTQATFPAMRHVKRVLTWASVGARPALAQINRATVVVLDPVGFMGDALLRIVKMGLKVMAPPWKTAIMPTHQSAQQWLATSLNIGHLLAAGDSSQEIEEAGDASQAVEEAHPPQPALPTLLTTPEERPPSKEPRQHEALGQAAEILPADTKGTETVIEGQRELEELKVGPATWFSCFPLAYC